MCTRTPLFLSLICFIIGLSNCKSDNQKQQTPSTPPPKYKVEKTLSHDSEAFTQGLIYHEGKIIEGTGLNGTSWISMLNPQTMSYDKKVIVPDDFFGEGITILNNKIYQLTYQSRVGFIYDAQTFEQVGTFEYDSPMKEGWGITQNGTDLIMSDGTTNLYFVDTTSFKIKKTLTVQSKQSIKSNLNELEYIEGFIYANIWRSNQILKIDPNSGEVLDTYDLSGLHKQAKFSNPKIDVLNGIAYKSDTQQLIVTGKYWPLFYYIKLL